MTYMRGYFTVVFRRFIVGTAAYYSYYSINFNPTIAIRNLNEGTFMTYYLNIRNKDSFYSLLVIKYYYHH